MAEKEFKMLMSLLVAFILVVSAWAGYSAGLQAAEDQICNHHCPGDWIVEGRGCECAP